VNYDVNLMLLRAALSARQTAGVVFT